MGLPSALGILAVGAGGRQDQVPQAVDGLGIGHPGEDLAGPCGHGNAGDAPDVAAEVHTVAERAALGVARLAGGGGLGGIDALEGRRIAALEEEEGGSGLGKAVELLDLPGRGGLEPLGLDVLVGKAGHGVVVPDHGHVTGAGAVGAVDHAAREVGALDGSLDHELLAGLQGNALLDEEVGVEVELVGEGGRRDAALLVGHGDRRHVLVLSAFDVRCSYTQPQHKKSRFRGSFGLHGAGNGTRTRGCQLGKLMPYHLAMPA